MNIGSFEVNEQGVFVGKIATLSVSMTLALSAVTSDNKRAPVYEVYARGDNKAWVKVGALWEQTSNSTGEVFYQGRIDDPSLSKPLDIACFSRPDGSLAVAWSRPTTRRDVPNVRTQGNGNQTDGLGESTIVDEIPLPG